MPFEDARTPLLPNADPESATTRTTRIRKWTSVALFSAVVLFVFAVAAVLSQSIQALPVSSARVVAHLAQLEAIAAANGGTRSVAGTGHRASVDYVVETLRNNTDLNVWTEELQVWDQVDASPPKLAFHNTSFTPRLDFMTSTFSGSGSLTNTPLISVNGCSAPQTTGPFVALIHQQTSIPTTPACDTSLCARVAFAIQSGAKGILLAANPTAQGYPNSLAPSGRLPRTCTPQQQTLFSSVPILSLSQSLSWKTSLQLMDNPTSTVISLSATTQWKSVAVWNVLAEPRVEPRGWFQGKNDSIVVFGCHLDSVRAGPGVNDDGSGAMATLELAVAYAQSKGFAGKSMQKIRFAWWTAEEIGLLGSIYHVENLFKNDPTLLSHYKLNIDTDMIASPNYVRGIWDGRSVEDERIRGPAIAIQSVFEAYFEHKGLPTVPFKFNGRSDFAAFMARGIPAGGVITGEDEIKTLEQAELFGGVAGMVLDPNYHQPEDTVEKLRGPGGIILDQNLKALGHALKVFAVEKNLGKFLKG
ncbi:hypothetical protein HDU98_010334 [Podochytrium sp. JEL0797]|nr:hypothetical protein HDU98_010334 [Podochytrium sp. JEL0797]